MNAIQGFLLFGLPSAEINWFKMISYLGKFYLLESIIAEIQFD
jgi:hypothetical protein